MPRPDKPLPSLDALQRRIDAARAQDAPQEQAPQGSALGKATQLASEFIAGAGVGGVGGYFLDRWLSTSPLFLLVGFLLGFAAGVYNLLRGAGKRNNV